MEMVLHGRIDEVYNDNVNTSGTDSQSDWLTNAMIGIDFVSEIRSVDISLTGNLYQQYSVENEERNVTYQDLMFALNKNFSENVTFGLSDVLQHYPESRSFGVLFGRSDANTGYLSNNFTTGLTVYATGKLFFTGVYSNGIMNNDSDTMSDTVLHNPGGSIGYSFDTANIVRLSYLYTLMKYDNGNSNRGDRGYIEYEKYYTKQLRSILHGGYDYIRTAEGEGLSNRVMISIIDDVDKNNQLDISYLKEKTISNISNDIFDNWRISGTLTRDISERVAISLTLFYGIGTYQISKITEKLGAASIGLSFVVTEFVNFNIGYNYTRSNTKAPGIEENSYNRNQISVGLSAVY